jgi:hypothetical protein
VEIADSRGGLWAGLVVEAGLVGMGIFGLVVGVPLVGSVLLAATLWGGLIAVWFAFSVRLHADGEGLRGRVGFERLELRWAEVAEIRPYLGQLLLELADGSQRKFRAPNWSPENAAGALETLRRGGVVRIVDDLPKRPSQRYAIPRGVETHLALEKSATELLCVNVLVGGDDLDDVARASRILAVRAADENRWDPTFSGHIRLLVSALRTPVTPAFSAQMETALEGARADLKQRGWSVAGGKPFELGWKMMGERAADPVKR